MKNKILIVRYLSIFEKYLLTYVQFGYCRSDQPNLKSFSPGALGSGKPNQIKLLQYDKSLAKKFTA